jgi:hypothetical protein
MTMAEPSVGGQEPTPKPVGVHDVSALIGWLASVEGEIVAGDVPEDLVEKLRKRFVGAGLLQETGNERAFRQAINDMNYRLRYALDELAEPPTPIPVPD